MPHFGREDAAGAAMLQLISTSSCVSAPSAVWLEHELVTMTWASVLGDGARRRDELARCPAVKLWIKQCSPLTDL